MSFLEFAIIVSEVLLTLSLLFGFYRLCSGPTVVDRIIAFDLIALAVVAFSAVVSVQEGTPHYVELLLIVSLVGFFGTVVLVSLLDRSQDEDPQEKELSE